MHINKYDEFLLETVKLLRGVDKGEYYEIETDWKDENFKMDKGLLPGRRESRVTYRKFKTGPGWFEAKTGKQMKDRNKTRQLERWLDDIEEKKKHEDDIKF